MTTHGRLTTMLDPVTKDNIEDALLAYGPTLRKKVEAGLKDIRENRTMLLADYKATCAKKKRVRVSKKRSGVFSDSSA